MCAACVDGWLLALAAATLSNVMRMRSLIGSVALVLGFLIAAGLASRAHPLSSGGWSASRRTTDFLMVGAFLVAAALIIALAIESHRPDSTARRQSGIGDVLFVLLLLAAIAAGAYGLGRAFHSSGQPHSRVHGVACVTYERAHGRPTSNCGSTTASVAKQARHATRGGSRAPWVALGAIVALLLSGGALFAFERRRPSAPRTEIADDRRGAIVDALDLSIDDLRQELRAERAIIAAYARMETAFTTAGLPRRPSDAPDEFLVRSLHELDVSPEAPSRLTELFELAKFSDHAATLAMRDEAIDALIAIRDELTAPVGAANQTGQSERSAFPTTT